MTYHGIVFLIFTQSFSAASILNSSDNYSDAESHHDDSTCYFIDPDLDVLRWAHLTDSQNCSFDKLTATGSEAETERRFFGYSNHRFDVLVSDKIGPRRNIVDTAHELCHLQNYSAEHWKPISVVIVYHNEALSVLIRMINSIFDRTDAKLLHEIVLLDDYSDEELTIDGNLKEYANHYWSQKSLLFERTDRREGLIRAKIIASRLASGHVLVFMDSHCEVNVGWLPPILDRISREPNLVALPMVDVIEPRNFNYSGALLFKTVFDWRFKFDWSYLPWNHFKNDTDFIRPFDSPSMIGGIFAVRKDYFHEIGEFDSGMEIWGAENIEMPLRVWMCGGRVEVVPCSRVGHVFRWRPF